MKKKFGFTLMEIMVVMLILSILMIAFAPLMTQKSKMVDKSSPWKWANSNDAYFGIASNQIAMIGAKQENEMDEALKPRLSITNKRSSRSPMISFHDDSNVLAHLYIPKGSATLMLNNKQYYGGKGNTFIGIGAGSDGVDDTTHGNLNTAIGFEALGSNMNGKGNIAIGTGPKNINVLVDNNGEYNWSTISDWDKNITEAFKKATSNYTRTSIFNEVKQSDSKLTPKEDIDGLDQIINFDYPLTNKISYLYKNRTDMNFKHIYAVYDNPDGGHQSGGDQSGNHSNTSLSTYDSVHTSGYALATPAEKLELMGDYLHLNGGGGGSYINPPALPDTSEPLVNQTQGFPSPLMLNTSGSFNIAMGSHTLSQNVAGHRNIGIGAGAAYKTGKYGRPKDNIAIGTGALLNNIDSSNNIAIGTRAAFYSQRGQNIIAIGKDAARGSTSGSPREVGDNTIAIGENACQHSVKENVVCIGKDSGPAEYKSHQYGNKTIAENQKSNTIYLGDENTTVYIKGNLVVDGQAVLGRKDDNKKNITIVRVFGTGTNGPNDREKDHGHLRPLGRVKINGEWAVDIRDEVMEDKYGTLSLWNAKTYGSGGYYYNTDNAKIGSVNGGNVRAHNLLDHAYFVTPLSNNYTGAPKVLYWPEDSYIISDRRLKNVGEISNDGLAKIRELKIYNFTYKKDEQKTPRVGVMAQDLKKIFPNAVTEDKSTKEKYLLIRQEDMFYAMVNAVKELDTTLQNLVKQVKDITAKIAGYDKQIKALQKENKELKAKLQNIEKQNKAIENRLKAIEKKL